MSSLADMTRKVVYGTRHDRVRVLGVIGVRFALAAFLIACFQHYADPFVSVNLSSNYAPVVGATLATVIGAFIKAPV
jgi:hypothetical protein